MVKKECEEVISRNRGGVFADIRFPPKSIGRTEHTSHERKANLRIYKLFR